MRVVSFEGDDKLQFCSAIATSRLVLKNKDPGSFTVPCSIGMLHFSKALCVLGANINLISLSVFKKVGLGSSKLTTI